MLYDCQYFFRGLLNVQGEKLKNFYKNFSTFMTITGAYRSFLIMISFG